MEQEVVLPDRAEVRQVVIVRPGDTLVIGVPPGTSQTIASEMDACLTRLMHDVQVVVVATDQMIVYRPGSS